MNGTLMLLSLWALTTDATRSAALDELTRTLPPGARVASLELQSLSARGRRATTLRLVAPPERGRARFCLETEDATGQRMPVQWLQAGVQLCGPVWVANHELTPGASLGAADLRREDRCGVELAALSSSNESLLGTAARRHLTEGAVVEQRDVVQPPLIRAHQSVALTVQRGALTIRTQGVALEDAVRGQSVQVRVRGHGAPMQGLAVGPQQVEVVP
ncbi:MAG: flagellar basal body P-ring formation chaperone FlgA [Pseudomonadota bacterium]